MQHKENMFPECNVQQTPVLLFRSSLLFFFLACMYLLLMIPNAAFGLPTSPEPLLFLHPNICDVFFQLSVHICDDDSPENWLVICLLVLITWSLLVFHSSFLCCFCLEFFKTWWNLVCFQHWCAAMFTLNLTMINNVITFVREPLMFQRRIREIRSEITFNFFLAKAHSGLAIMLQSHGAEKENVDHEFFIWWFNILDVFWHKLKNEQPPKI